MFVYTEDLVIYRFVTYRNSTRHKMKYDREICIISFKSIMVIHTKEKKIKVFPIGRRQKQTFLS